LSPRLLRCDTSLGNSEHAQVAGRLYLASARCPKGEECPPPSTIVGDAARFASGLSWRLGSTPLRVDRWAFGDSRRLWTVNAQSSLDQLDVSDPARIAVATRHGRTYTTRLIALRLPEVILFDFSTFARVARLDDSWSILSRVYRLTISATDSAGTSTRTSRMVHVVPYDHAPAVSSLTVVPPGVRGGLARLRVEATDPDGLASWDPMRFARVDFDGDGAFDTDWQWMTTDGSGLASVEIDVVPGGPGRVAVVQVRDGFWASARASVELP
jgi:hypothetical protein